MSEKPGSFHRMMQHEMHQDFMLGQWLLRGVGGMFVIAVVVAASEGLGFSRSVSPGLMEQYERRFGQGARGRLEGWKAFAREQRAQGAAQGASLPATPPDGAREIELLRAVNAFFNRVPYLTDRARWGMDEYWATPAEMVGIHGGDCEDYAIAKYFTLKELGVSVPKLRLVYASTWHSRQAHMVLAYYPEKNADPLILDSLEANLSPASGRPDLTPMFTFNEDDLLLMGGPGQAPMRSEVYSVRSWRELVERLERELRY